LGEGGGEAGVAVRDAAGEGTDGGAETLVGPLAGDALGGHARDVGAGCAEIGGGGAGHGDGSGLLVDDGLVTPGKRGGRADPSGEDEEDEEDGEDGDGDDGDTAHHRDILAPGNSGGGWRRPRRPAAAGADAAALVP